MIDVRQYRDPPPCGGGLADCPERLGEDRTLLGAEQQAWLEAGLATSDSIWDVIGQQVVFSPMPFGGLYNNDQWDGYPQQRDRVWAMLRQRPNPVVVTGDIHAAGVAALHETLGDVSTPRIGTELVGTSVSSRFDEALVDAAEALIKALPYVEYANARDRGYTVVDLTRDRMRGDLQGGEHDRQSRRDGVGGLRDRGGGPLRGLGLGAARDPGGGPGVVHRVMAVRPVRC